MARRCQGCSYGGVIPKPALIMESPTVLLVGRGVVGTELHTLPNFEIVSHTDFPDTNLSSFAAVVNCAGIVGARNCEEATFTDLFAANVFLPRDMKARCVAENTPFVQLSTIGVYASQTCPDIETFTPPDETSPVIGLNRYVYTKIRMEQHLLTEPLSGVYVFRLPWVNIEAMFLERAAAWTAVQNTFTSIVNTNTLATAIRKVAEDPSVPGGLYNIASSVVHFPTFINAMRDAPLPTRSEYSATMTSAIPVSVEKAIRAGLIEKEQNT